MTFKLYVDGPRWRAHTGAVVARTPGIVPVMKGNGYGYGRAFLAAEAARLDVDTVAVGEAHEVASVRDGGYQGDILVLMPYLPGVDAPPPGRPDPDDLVVRTVAGLDSLDALRGHRVVVELLSSMRRFGLSDDEVDRLPKVLDAVQLQGFALHLPLVDGEVSRVAEAQNAITRLRLAGLPVRAFWVSHLSAGELAELGAANPDVSVRARIGTRLWLGDPGATQARGTVLAVHRLRRGDRYGYRQRRAPRSGHLVVVSGGTSHGVALSAPTPAVGLTQRAKTVAIGGLEAVGRSLSPFTIGGTQRWFAEPPHMQVSMLWLPDDGPAPAVGSELVAEVRMTTCCFDEVVVED